MKFKRAKFKVTGVTPLMHNNPQTVNPLNDYAKKLKVLTSKRTKTEDDLEEISHIKFLSCLYQNQDGVYIIPAEHFERSIINSAKERKLGKKFEQSFHIFSDVALDFKDKDKTPEELYQIGSYLDIRIVGIKNSKITTTRAIFNEWSATVECDFDETQIDERDLIEVFTNAGLRHGIGTFRRNFGKYSIQKIK